MKKIYLSTILFLMGCSLLSAQEFDITLSSAESGTKTHQARNSITFGPNYSYTPSGGTMTAEIVNPVVAGDMPYGSIVNPETRSLNTSYLVGTTSGSFNVNALGGAAYTIPIDVAPGVAGLQPGLALTYNSLGGMGVIGYGWDISGISAITRSPQTYYHDTQSVGVNLTSTDRFSLDGQRLVCISGSYGGNGSVYRTEYDIFSKVTCYTGSSGPDRFEVKTKSGLTCQYGFDSDADQTITGHNETVSWYVNKITDVYGNYMDFTYLKDGGYNYLAEITYGPNTVTFFYKQRSDKTTSYLKGSMLEQRLILEKIEVKYNTNVVKKYEFKYNYPASNYTSYSVMNEVIEYGISNSRINSTVFSYQTPDNVTFAQTVYNTSHNYISYKSKMCMGDFDGDGSEDVLAIDDPNITGSYSGWKLNINNGNNSFSTYSGDFSIDETKILDMYSVDLNGDGMEDIVLKEDFGVVYWQGMLAPTDRYHYALSTGTSFGTLVEIGLAQNSILYSKLDNNKIGDFNGDGLSDIILIHSNLGYWSMYSFTYSGGQLNPLSKTSYGNFSAFNNDSKRYVTDWNGDGIAEILTVDDNGTKIYTISGSSFSEVGSSTIPKTGHYFVPGDFNADGKTDLFIYGYTTYDWSDWQMRLSTGTGFTINYIPKKKNNLKNDIIRVGDFNGDGCSDLMVMAVNDAWSGHYYYITRNQGADLYSHFYSGAQSSTHSYFVADFDGDGRDDYLCTDGVSPYWNGYMIYKSGTKNKIMMEKVANGLNQLTNINYKTLSQYGAPYTKATGASFPVFDYQGALPVVSSVLSDNGQSSQNTINYTYEGVKIHRQGKGFLCMAKQTVTDPVTNLKTENSYGYHATKYFPMLSSTVNKYMTTTLSTVSNSWTYSTPVTGVIFPYISSSTQTNSLTGHSMTQTASYDSYGNPTQIVKSFNNGVTETTTNVFTNDATNWLLGKMTSSTVQYSKSGETTISQTTSLTYSTDGKLKPDFIKYYEGTDLYYYKNHDYNSQGNLTQLYEYGNGVGARTTTYTYETSNHVRLKTVNDPLGHTTTKNYDTYGRLSSEVDYLNNTNSYTYDNLGRVLTHTQPDGFVATTSYNWGLTGGPTYSCYNVQQSGNDGSVTKTWYDELAREIRNDVKGFSGSYIYTVTEYYTNGHLKRISEPSTSTSPSLWNTNTYDNYGRVATITRPTGRNTTYSYSSNRVTETTGGKSSWKETDSQGLVTTANDNGGSITYAYYPDGKVKTITAPGSVLTTMEYNDAARNQTKLIDPSAGTIEYTYNAFGQLKTQKNARNQTTTYNYHADGRISSKVTPEGTNSYTYNGNEQLTGISSPGSVSRSFGYDSKGRVNNISGTIPGSTAFSTTFTYDNKGRLSTRTHPSGIVETNNYNIHGYLASISAGSATWTINGMNARQQITAANYGSNLTGEFGFDSFGYPKHIKAKVGSTYRQDYRYAFNTVTGNLTTRKDSIPGEMKTESFTYDNLDRLLTVTGPQNLTMDYAVNGNILTKSDVGTNTFEYNHSTKPYVLTDLETASGLVPEALQTVTYTSFEQPLVITESPYLATFTYNSEGQRAKMEVKQSGNTILTRWYAGSRYIKETAGAVTKEYWWLGGDAYSAPILAVKQGSTTTYYYILRDHLGTITHLTNTSGTVQNRYSFDAWGRRRSPESWEYSLPAQTDLLPGRGFTGHEQLSHFGGAGGGLYNMNGRIYDPVVGRFLSADNYVQAPDNTQSYNRYSYCLNNPLKYTDPDGELFWIIPNIGWSKEGGLSIGISAVFGIPGSVLSVQAGANYSFGSNDFSIYRGVSALGNTAYWSLSTQSGLNVGYAFGATPYSGLPVSTNFLSAGVNYNITHNSWSGNVSAWQVGNGGWTFNPSVSAMVLPEQTTNFARGQGFRSNNQVLSNFVDANNYQGALDYWGFKGTYMPDHPLLNGKEPGVTDPVTGDIFYNTSAFLGTFDKLYLTYDHELWHHKRVTSKKFERSGNTVAQEEYLNYMRNYRRQGLYKKHGLPIEENINGYGSILKMPVEKYMPYSQFENPFWHNVFKIRRLW